jgi:peptidoglycan/LPS O-acetylase OafA/YrhL
MPPPTQRVVPFDGLRCLALTCVVLLHTVYQPAVAARAGHGLWRVASHLDVGPSIFFVISGFLLYRPFVAARAGGRGVSLPAYGVRRALRILPAYWLALTVITVWFSLGAVRHDPLRYYLLAQVYHADSALGGMPQAWTLCVEIAFYMLLPLWALAVRRLAALRGGGVVVSELAGIALLVAVGVVWNGIALTHSDPAAVGSRALLQSLPAYIDQLALGMLLAVASIALAEAVSDTPPGLIRLLRRLERVPGGAWWLAALVVWLPACFVVGPSGAPGDVIDDTGFLAKHLLYGAMALLLVAPAALGAERGGRVRGALAWPPVVWVGTISYSIYLWHFAIVGQVARWWGGAPDGPLGWLAWTAAVVAGALLIGTAGYLLVEVPTIRLGRRLSRRLQRRPDALGPTEAVPEPAPTIAGG